jgi:hypothetical protein
MVAFSYSPGAAVTHSISPGNINTLTLHDLLQLTPKKYHELTGKRMTFKQKIALTILKLKMKKQVEENTPAKKHNYGTLSLLFGVLGVLSLLVNVGAVVLIGFFLALAALILGIKGLKQDGKDLKALFGVILGGGYMILVILALLVVASFAWN